MANDVLTDVFSVPLDGATTAEIDINAGYGNLTIDRLTDGEGLLASGSLQYLKDQGAPKRSVAVSGGRATIALIGGSRQPRFRLPWAACRAATESWIHLNPAVSYDLVAHSDGGNVRVDLAGVAVTRVSTDTGGGNIDLALPDNASNLDVKASTGGGNLTIEVGSGITGSNTVNARSGAGNVVVRVPGDIAARVQATSGLGKVTVDPRLSKVDKSTYQSPDFDSATNRLDIVASSGAGNVIVETK